MMSIKTYLTLSPATSTAVTLLILELTELARFIRATLRKREEERKRAIIALARKIMKLEIVPITFAEANSFVKDNHRHHNPVAGHKFSIACSDGEKIVGVAMVGRPVSRYLDDGWTLEVNRLCTNGTKNACSMLYAAAWRAARAMGYKRIITYILDTENGASIKAAGYRCIGQCGGERWTGKRRPEIDLYPAQLKLKFEKSD
jgi:hypothetical protein